MLLLLFISAQTNLTDKQTLPILVSEVIVSNSSINKTYPKMKQNNPFNIRVNKANKWLGKVPTTNGFEAFDTMEHGIRAGIKLLQNYYTKKGLNTVTDIIKVYAPTIENDTNHYIEVVCQHTGFKPNEVINLMNRDTITRLAEAMIFMEQGVWLNPISSTYVKYFNY